MVQHNAVVMVTHLNVVLSVLFSGFFLAQSNTTVLEGSEHSGGDLACDNHMNIITEVHDS